jgi:hypothetical protein
MEVLPKRIEEVAERDGTDDDPDHHPELCIVRACEMSLGGVPGMDGPCGRTGNGAGERATRCRDGERSKENESKKAHGRLQSNGRTTQSAGYRREQVQQFPDPVGQIVIARIRLRQFIDTDRSLFTRTKA